MLKLLLGLLGTVAVLYLGACLLLFLSQRSLIYLPSPGGPAVAEGLTRLAAPNGRELLVSVRRVPGPKALLYFGGNAEDVSFSLPELAAELPEHSLFLLHYPGYAGAPGAPSEEALHAGAIALFDLVHAELPRVSVVGRSLGSGVAVRLAAERPVDRLVLVTPYDSLAALGAAQFPLFPVRWLMRDKYSSIDLAPRITVPTLVLVAEHDEIIPVAHSRRLYEAFAPGIARWVVLPGVGHNSISASEEYLPALQAGV